MEIAHYLEHTGRIWILVVYARHEGGEMTIRMVLPREPDDEVIGAARGAAGVLLERAMGEM